MRSTGAKEWWATKSVLFAIVTTVAFATAGVMIALAQAAIMDPPTMTPGPGATVAVSWLPVAPVGSSLTTYTLSWDTDPAFPATHTVVTTNLSTTIAGVDGVTYYAVVQADDGSGVLSDPSAVAQATADGIRPVSSFAAVPASPDGLNGWYKSVPTASMSIVDTGTGLQSFVVNTVDVSADPGLTFGLPPDPSTYVVPALGQGVNSFSFFGTDVAGNVETPAKTASVSVDSVVPTCAVSAAAGVAHITAGDPAPGSGVNHIDYVFLPTGSSPDTFTAWTSVAGSSVTSSSPPGPITVFARSVDTAGNVSNIQQAVMNNTFVLTYLASPGGSIVGSSTQVLLSGSNGTTVTATPNTGYHFVSWSDGVLTAARQDLNITANLTVTANFAINTYTLVYTAGAHGQISGSTTLVDSYSESNWNAIGTWGPGATTGSGESFTAIGGTLDSAKFYLRAHGSPTGMAYAKLYAHSGTYGVSSLPTGSPLAISQGVDVSTLSSSFALVVFQFDNSVTLTNGTAYCIVVEHTGTSSTSYLESGYDSSGGHPGGNAMYRWGTGSWNVDSGDDVFYVYEDLLASSQTVSVNYNANGSAVAAVPATGYHFVSWSDNGSTNPVRQDLNVTSDVTANAIFAIDTYTLAYTAGNGGSIVGSSTQVVNFGSNGTTVTATPNTGYHFVSWSDGVLTAARQDLAVAANVTVTANFAINTYTITFNSNGGSAVTAITQAPGTAVSAPTAPTKAGSTFAGWFSDAGLTTAYTFTTMPAVDTTLYAKWTVNTTTITFNSNGGSAVTAITQAPGIAVSAPTAPTKAGSTFAGWFSDAGLTTAYTFTTMPAVDTTLYAKWTAGTTLIPTRMTMNANHTSVLRGHLVHFFGVIQPNMPNGTPIAFLVRKAGTIRWVRAVPYVRTFNGYHWSYYYHPSKAGIYYIKVRFSATSTFAAVNSRTVKVTWR